MSALQVAWTAYRDHSNTENLTAFLYAALAFTEAGGTLPADMARTYRLATGAQLLPRVVIKPISWLWLWLLLGAGATVWLWGDEA